MHVHARVERSSSRARHHARGEHFHVQKYSGDRPAVLDGPCALFIPLYCERGLANFDDGERKKRKGVRSIKKISPTLASRSRNVDSASHLNEGSESCLGLSFFLFSFCDLRRKAMCIREVGNGVRAICLTGDRPVDAPRE